MLDGPARRGRAVRPGHVLVLFELDVEVEVEPPAIGPGRRPIEPPATTSSGLVVRVWWGSLGVSTAGGVVLVRGGLVEVGEVVSIIGGLVGLGILVTAYVDDLRGLPRDDEEGEDG